MLSTAGQTISLTIVIYILGFNPHRLLVPFVQGATDNDVNTSIDENSSDIGEFDTVDLHHFGYDHFDGPARWARVFHDCGGRNQSPVSLDTTTAVSVHKPRISWWGYSLKPEAMMLVNNGHTVVLRGRWQNNLNPCNWDSSNGDDIYVFDHIHFHWGPDDESGSEHTLNTEKFPLEMHVVHYRKALGSLDEASRVFGGIKVVAILFRISEHNNSAINDILDGLDHVHRGNTPTEVPPIKLSHLIPGFNKQYLTYNGSLTTPPCSESVNWVVYSQAAVVSQLQVEHFRHFSDDESGIITHNHRPVQPLNGRVVLHVV